MIQHIAVPGATSPLPFSAAVKAGGFVFISGVASANERGELIHDTFDNEARRTFENLQRVVRAAGLELSDIVQVRCYLAKQEHWDAHNRIYREYFSEPYPARTTLVGCLGDLIQYEVDAVAFAGK